MFGRGVAQAACQWRRCSACLSVALLSLLVPTTWCDGANQSYALVLPGGAEEPSSGPDQRGGSGSELRRPLRRPLDGPEPEGPGLTPGCGSRQQRRCLKQRRSSACCTTTAGLPHDRPEPEAPSELSVGQRPLTFLRETRLPPKPLPSAWREWKEQQQRQQQAAPNPQKDSQFDELD